MPKASRTFQPLGESLQLEFENDNNSWVIPRLDAASQILELWQNAL